MPTKTFGTSVVISQAKYEGRTLEHGCDKQHKQYRHSNTEEPGPVVRVKGAAAESELSYGPLSSSEQ